MTTDAAMPIVRLPGEGTTIQGPAGGPLVFKVRGDEAGGSLTAVENVIAPGDGPPLHVHANEDESWFIIEGTVRFRLGDELSDAPAGSFVFVPRGVAHCFANFTDTPARMLVMFTPSGMERFFDAFAATPDGVPVPEAFARAAATAGMTVVGPPLWAEAS
jgi:mannose-6-phosphate isomerase-like protein (cupin superfamily)